MSFNVYTHPHTYVHTYHLALCVDRLWVVCVMCIGDCGHYYLQGDPSVKQWHLVSRSLWLSWGSGGIRCQHHAAMVIQPQERERTLVLYSIIYLVYKSLGHRNVYYNPIYSSTTLIFMPLCQRQPWPEAFHWASRMTRLDFWGQWSRSMWPHVHHILKCKPHL